MNGAGSRSANAGVRGAVRPSSPPIIRGRPETAGRMYGRRPTRVAAGAHSSGHPSPRAERSEPGSEQDPAADDELLPAAQLETQLRERRDTARAELGTTQEVPPDLRVARGGPERRRVGERNRIDDVAVELEVRPVHAGAGVREEPVERCDPLQPFRELLQAEQHTGAEAEVDVVGNAGLRTEADLSPGLLRLHAEGGEAEDGEQSLSHVWSPVEGIAFFLRSRLGRPHPPRPRFGGECRHWRAAPRAPRSKGRHGTAGEGRTGSARNPRGKGTWRRTHTGIVVRAARDGCGGEQ